MSRKKYDRVYEGLLPLGLAHTGVQGEAAQGNAERLHFLCNHPWQRLIIGIDDSRAIPSAFCGFELSGKKVDSLKRRTLDVVQINHDPRNGLEIQSVAIDQDIHFFVIRVQKSLADPHRVVYRDEYGQFWSLWRENGH